MTSFHKSVSTAKKDQEEKKNTAVSKLEQFLFGTAWRAATSGRSPGI